MKKMSGKVAVITGAGSGLGKRVAEKLADLGMHLALLDINKTAVDEVVKTLVKSGANAFAYKVDITNRKAVYSCAAKIYKRFEHVDLLINNAGVVGGKRFLESKDEDNELTMQVNIISNFWTVKAFLPGMIEQGSGHLVTISSAAGLVGVAKLADYCASKFAAFGFHESIRMELKKSRLRKIKTTIVSPFYINTGMFHGVKTRFNVILPLLVQEKVADKIVQSIVKGRQRLYMPLIVYTLPLLRLFPVSFLDFVASVLGINATMDEFTGRDGKEK